MSEIKTIFTHNNNELGINYKTRELYWNKKKIITEQKLTLNWWVSIAIVLGGFSTAVLVFIECLKCIKGGA